MIQIQYLFENCTHRKSEHLHGKNTGIPAKHIMPATSPEATQYSKNEYVFWLMHDDPNMTATSLHDLNTICVGMLTNSSAILETEFDPA